MNRRELLKRLGAVPFLGLLVPVTAKPVVAESAVDYAEEVEPLFMHTYKHVQCALAYTVTDESVIDESEPLCEGSLEKLCKQLSAEVERTGKPLTVRPTHVHLRAHSWDQSYWCEHCGCSATDVEEGLEPIYCWKNCG